MGQSLPLPERIPRPDGKTLTAMNECGIIINDEPDQEYLTYSLPNGWRTVDNSWREDLPQFYIVDNNNMVRFSITGAWKGTYDNKLNLRTIGNPYEFKSRHDKVVPSETNTAAIMGKLGQAVDPLHRPPPQLHAVRKPDYEN